jgi:hypothetical protein
MSDNDPIADLERRVAKMRELGVTRWDGIELGPSPVTGGNDNPAPESAEVKDRRERAEQHRVAMSASGRLVRRLGHNQD